MGARIDKLILHYGYLVYHPHPLVQVPVVFIASLVPARIKFSSNSTIEQSYMYAWYNFVNTSPCPNNNIITSVGKYYDNIVNSQY